MKISKEFFGLQITFCKKVAEVTGKKFSDVLYLYSDFFNRLWIGRKKGDVSEDFQSYVKNPKWEKFLKKYFNPKRPVQSTYNYYLKELKKDEKRRLNVKPRTSCFRYELEGENTIRIHANMYFRENKFSPLSIKNIKFREEELKKILGEVRKKYPKVKQIRGHSWLYAIKAYQRLFPKSYLKNAKETRWTIQGFSLWGQFLNKNGQVKKELSKAFLEKVRKAKTMNQLWRAFPLMPVEVRGSIKDFYKMYGIK